MQCKNKKETQSYNNVAACMGGSVSKMEIARKGLSQGNEGNCSSLAM